MFSRRYSPSSIFAVAALLGLGAQARAELAATSPFLPPQGQVINAPVAGAPLEFRGVTTSGGMTKFSIFDPAKKSGNWVGMNESGFDFAVKKYEPDSDTVIVDYQGRSLTLAMKTPKVASLGSAVAPMTVPTPMIAAMPSPVPGAPGTQNLVTRNVVANPTPATEAARLADWQAEIQRRRDMRAQQAAAQTNVQPQAQAQAQPNQPQNGTRRGQGGQRRTQ
jgi:hypothetical protein